jgi:hypothetical protein
MPQFESTAFSRKETIETFRLKAVLRNRNLGISSEGR